jgi:hypothetical protein
MILLGMIAAGHVICFILVLNGGAGELVSQQQLGTTAVLYGLALVGTVVLTIPAGITFVVWAVRTRKNVDALGAYDLEYSAWFPVYFVVPVLNLFVPLLAFQEIWRASDPASTDLPQHRRGSRIIYFWWAFFLLASIAGALPRLLAERDKRAAEIGLAAPYHVLAAIAAGLAIAMIWRFLQRQRAHPGSVVPATPAASAGLT